MVNCRLYLKVDNLKILSEIIWAKISESVRNEKNPRKLYGNIGAWTIFSTSNKILKSKIAEIIIE